VGDKRDEMGGIANGVVGPKKVCQISIFIL